MARRCALTSKSVLSGNKVSHSNRKTKRKFLPNLQNISIYSDILGIIKMRISTRALKSIDMKGGIDNYLMLEHNANLPPKALSLKKLIKKHLSNNQNNQIDGNI